VTESKVYSPETDIDLRIRPITLGELIQAMIDLTTPIDQQNPQQPLNETETPAYQINNKQGRLNSYFRKGIIRHHRLHPSDFDTGQHPKDIILSAELVANILYPPQDFAITYIGEPDGAIFTDLQNTIKHLLRSDQPPPHP